MTVSVYAKGLTVEVKDKTPVSPGLAGWSDRKAAPGVVRSFKFDNEAMLGGRGADYGIYSGTSAPHGKPVIDALGLRFDIPAFSGSDACGTWYGNFGQFGENTEFFVQWRQRFNPAFITTVFNAVNGGVQGGIKQIDIDTGDTPTRVFYSCEALEVVVQTYYQHRFPIVYNSCTGSGSHGAYSGMYERIGSSDFGLENAVPEPFCRYSQTQELNTWKRPASVPAGCFGWAADEWMTFQVGITVGPRNNVTNDFDNSRTRLWAAREGKPSQLLVDWKPGVRGYFPLAAGPASENQRFGKVWLLPYMTNKDPAQDHPLCQTWYDELIVSTQQIADAQ